MAEKKVVKPVAPKQSTTTITKKQPVKTATAAPAPKLSFLFTRENYLWMIIGGVTIALGMLLMSGGKNENPNTFDYSVVYSTTRVTIAPILIVLGLLIEVYAIFKKPKQNSVNS